MCEAESCDHPRLITHAYSGFIRFPQFGTTVSFKATHGIALNRPIPVCGPGIFMGWLNETTWISEWQFL